MPFPDQRFGEGPASAYLSGMAKKVFLLDALALVFRAYYALIRNPRLTSKGKNTNAQFGFTNALTDLINKQQPSHMAVCFDTHAPTERHIDFEAYKANRQEAPEDILAAIPDIKRIIRAFNIPVVEMDGYEADDVIGTLSQQAAKAGYEARLQNADPLVGFIGAVKNLKIYSLPNAESDLQTKMQITNRIMNVNIASIAVSCDEQVVAECEMKVFLESEEKQQWV